MKLEAHNPEYKLISVIIDGKELVYGETNNGDNKGLEAYYISAYQNIYYSRRFTPSKIPMIYDRLYFYLSKLVKYCAPGQKLSLTRAEYVEIVTIFNSQPAQLLSL